jgi:cyanophycinase
MTSSPAGIAPPPARHPYRGIFRALCFTMIAFSAACRAGEPAADSGADASGRLVIVGGALQSDNADVYRAVLEATEGDGPFCVLPTASGVPAESMASATAAFIEHGADSVDGVFITTENPESASDPGIVTRLQACSGFWFVGGVQSRVVEVFRPEGGPTPAYDAVMERFRAGAVVAGSSAGAAIMSPLMIAGGTSAGALAHGVVQSDTNGDGVLVEPGMGFHDGPVFDQHFLARGRIGRLLVATLAGIGDGVGFGIDENTALVVHGRTGRVVGASGVVLVDAREATRPEVGHGGRGVRVHLIGSGDSFDMETLAVQPGAKAPVPATTSAVTPPADPFARWAFLEFLDAFAASEAPSVEMESEGYRITVERGPMFRATSYDYDGVQDTRAGLSLGPLTVSLVPEG